MKKKICLVLVLFLLIFACPIFIFGCTKQEERSVYDIFVSYQDESHSAQCFEEVTYVNNSENSFDMLCFHLYPNAFKEGNEKNVVSSASIKKTYPNGLSEGKIVINQVQIGKENVEFNISGPCENILSVCLNNKLFPGEKIGLTIDFTLFLPNINHRFGYGNNAVNFGNFYPIACVYQENEGFMTEPYCSNGDPFFSECADYNVTIKCENDFQVASTGQQTFSETCQGMKTLTYQAKNVRDFCFVLSKKFQEVEDFVGKTKVSYYFYEDENPSLSLKVAKDALSSFSDLFGQYPYDSLSVVQTNFVHGGMEFPNLVMISDQIENHQDYEYVIVHEVAHQWWYAVVGNDEFNESWLDESLTEYSTLLFYEKNPQYGLNYEDMIKNAMNSYKLFLEVYEKVYKKVDTSILRPINKFNTEPEYVNCVYTKGVLLFDTVRAQVGQSKFLKALRNYFKKFSYKIAKSDDLIAEFVDVCGKEIEDMFYSWLEGRVVII